MSASRLALAAVALAAATSAAGQQPGPPHPEGGSRAAAAPWSESPLLLPVRGGERGEALLRPVGIDAAEIRVHGPAGGDRAFPVGAAGARIGMVGGVGNYHWAVAREEKPGQVGVASTAWYFSNPGPSPRRLLAQAMSELEIVPDPLPREHASYRESEKWRFLVRFRGQPLAGQAVRMETEAGSRSRFLTDGDGAATVLFPRDLAPRPGGGQRREKAGFVLSTEHEADGRRYLTAFNQSYAADADRGRSLAWGAAMGLAGMLCAAPLLRRRKGTKPC